MTRDMKYEFKGINPDDNVRSYVAHVAHNLYFAAPSDSGLDLVVEKSKNAVKASCRIASQAGVFAAEAISENVINAVDQLQEKINQQLKSWKTQRFFGTSLLSGENLPLAS